MIPNDCFPSPQIHSTSPATVGCSRDSGPTDSNGQFLFVHDVNPIKNHVDDVSVRGGVGLLKIKPVGLNASLILCLTILVSLMTTMKSWYHCWKHLAL